eukprot:symbB.v1.2.011022.t1/scaffold731.1/size168158/3
MDACDLCFHDVNLLEPRLADSAASSFVVPEDGNSLEEASLSVCGAFFLEMWSDDGNGFPLPKGCYFGPAQGVTREMNVLFDAKNGLGRRKNYQLVINARLATGTNASDEVVAVWSMDEVTLPYGVVEVGDARLEGPIPVLASGVGEPRFSIGGFELLDPGARSLLLLEDPATVLFRLRGKVESPIAPSSLLRLFLRPLLMWDLPLCEARCFPHQSLTCGSVSCLPEEVAPGRRSIVKLTLPTDMTPLAGVVQHTIRLSQLTLPLQGFFGLRWAAQVSLTDDSRVHYTESSGIFLWKIPRSNTTTAGVVNMPGDGNQRPFRGQDGNDLYVQLLLGATLFSELQEGDASFTLYLPPGYQCLAATAAPETLRLFGAAIPQGRGTLESSHWDFDGSASCRYRLRVGEVIPAGTSVYIQLTVNQPRTALPVDGVNQWSVQLRSKGHFRVETQELPATNFRDGHFLGPAVSVLGRLQQSLVPSNFQVAAAVRLYVFFKPEQSSGYGGHVHVTCPRSFDVGNPCIIQPLDQVYYRIANDQDTVHLPVLRSCEGICSALDGCPGSLLNTAKISLENPLLPENFYGFQLSVQSPSSYSIEDEVSWAIVTTNAMDLPLDAAQPAVLNPASTSGAWGVFQEGSAMFSSVAFSSLWPTGVTGSLVLLTVLVQVPVSFTATARFISPVGFNLESTSVQALAAEVGAEMDWPGSLLSGSPGYDAEPRNTLLWSSANYLRDRSVGFSVACEVPLSSVSTMLSAALLQFGWDASSLTDRPLALVLPVGKVRSIVNFQVEYLSNVVSARQRIFVSLETMSDLPIGGRLVLTAPAAFEFQSLCSVLTVPGEKAPEGWESLQCDFANGEITLRPTSSFVSAGHFTFALDLWNPDVPLTSRVGHATACGHEKCWKVEIFNTIGGALDAPATTASFPVNPAMPHAQLVDLNSAQRYAAGRNDRPGQRNQLIFAFTLGLPGAMGRMRLLGPLGFLFDEDCLPGLSTSTALGGIFGSLSPIPSQFYAFEIAAKVQSCIGHENRATLHVDLGLRTNRLYALRVTVTNPLEIPEINTWSFEFASESAVAFPSFTVWTFTDISLTPKFRSISTTTERLPNPVTLRFRPHKDVPGDPSGMLRLTVPTGFTVATAFDACEEFFLRDLTANLLFSSSDVSCTPGSDSLSFVFRKRLDPGRLYELIVQVINPLQVPPTAEAWIAWTYADTTGTAEVAMDRSSFPGFQSLFRLSTWEVKGPNMEQHAGQSALVEFSLSSFNSIAGGSHLLVNAPKGFDLTSPPECTGNLGGSVLGGSSSTVGRSESLQACARRVWQEVPEGEAATWR